MKQLGWLASLFFLFLCISCNGGPDPCDGCPDGWTYDPTSYDFTLPSGWPPVDPPEDNPTTYEGVTLGRKLFYDPMLSGDGTQSCSSCHAQSHSFTDNNLQFSTGIDGVEGEMNAMALVNLAWGNNFFWDGRSVGLEAQAFEPVINPIEMHDDWDNVVTKLSADADYPKMFYEAFGDQDITADKATKAIAQFERTLISANSLYDKFIGGEGPAAWSDPEFSGMAIFFTERGDCFHCHVDKFFTDYDFHNNGLDASPDPGLYMVTGDANDLGKFRTPTLRNIEYTAPYMHDGRFATLEEVIDHYSTGATSSSTIDPIMNHSGAGLLLNFTDEEKTNLIAFLKSLSDEEFMTNPAFADPE